MNYKDDLSSDAITDRYEDLVFSRVMKLYMEAEYEDAKPNLVKTKDISPIEKLYSKVERRKTLRAFRLALKKSLLIVAVVVGAASISVAASVMAFAQVRVAVAEALYCIIAEESDLYTEVCIGNSAGFIDPELYDWEGAYAPTYMPAGFELEDKIFTVDERTIVYTCNDKYISFYQTTNAEDARVNTENFDKVEKLQIADSEALFIHRKKFLGVYLNKGNTFFCVEGNVSKEELILIAEGIKILR